MLEKYKKLAHDASLNGDRVLTEYYLQFADHYFRVVADSRSQKDDGRPRREHDREQPFESDEDEVEDREESGRDEGTRSEQPRRRRDREDDDRNEREEGPRGAEGDADEASADDNPFVRDVRRAEGRPVQRGRGRGRSANGTDEVAGETTFDPGLLPPSIARDEEAPRPTRGRGRRTRPADDGDDEALEAVS